MNQQSLFDTPPHTRVRASDPCTSLDAARSITPGRNEDRILDVFHSEPHPWFMGGMTDDEIVDRVKARYGPGGSPASIKSARSRLTGDGLLIDSGERRPSNFGRLMIVWTLAPERTAA